MPTVSASIDANIETSNGDLTARLNAQSGNLASLATTISNLINNPPTSLADFGGALNELPLPNLSIDTNFTNQLASIRGAVPSDLSSVVGAATGPLAGLGDLQASLGEILAPVMDAILAIFHLTEIDLTCFDSASAGTGTAPAGGGTGGGGGGATPGGGAAGGAPAAGTAGGSPANFSQANDQLDIVSGILDAAPSPFNIEGLLDFVRRATGFLQTRPGLFALPAPFVDEFVDPLQTLAAWKAMDASQIRDDLASTLQDLSAFISGQVDALAGGLASDLSATVSKLNGTALAQIADDLVTQLNAIRTAVSAANTAGAAAAAAIINTRLDDYAALRATLQPDLLAALPGLSARLSSFGGDLSERMDHLVSVLQPTVALRILDQIERPAAPDASAATELQNQVKPFTDFLQNVADKLDLTAIQDPLKTVADTARGAVDALQQGLTTITVQVQSLFSQLEALIGQLDTVALVNEVKAAIQNFTTELNAKVNELFKPVRDAVTEVVDQISAGVDAFNPQDIIDALRKVIDDLTSVLQSPEVLGAVTKIKDALDTVSNQLEQLSFAPVTDEVIKAIEEITDLLKSIDTSVLGVAAQGALQAAAAALPQDLKPVTDPFIDELGQAITAPDGPAQLVESIKDEPKKLLDKVRNFQPASLVGDTLSKPFNDLLAQVDKFKPSELLAPVRAEFDKLKDRISSDADPGAPLRALAGPFNELLADFDKLQPDALIAPLDDAIKSAVNTVLTAIPVDEIFAQVDAALGRVRDIVDFAKKLAGVIAKLKTLLEAFGDAQGQVDAFVDSILDKVAAADTGELAPRFAGVTTAVDATKSAALMARFQAGSTPLTAALGTLNARGRLAAIVQAYSSISQAAIAALPDSPDKSAITAALGRFNPVNTEFSTPFQAIGSLQENLAASAATLQQTLTTWDARYHTPDGVLTGLRATPASPAELKQGIREALEPQFIQPTVAILSFVQPVSTPLGGILQTFQDVITTLETKVADLLLGPNSLGGIRDALKALVDEIRGINLGFLRDSLRDVFAQVRAKTDAINPANLAAALDDAFHQMLNAIDVDQILPAADVKKLDDDYKEAIDKLKLLNPADLVVKIIQPEFEAKVVPLLDAFDLTKVLQAVIDVLNSLADELRNEMDRVNEKYKEMLAAIPSMSIDISASVDVGISL